MDYFYGYIALFPYTRYPSGWLLCDGRTLQISQNGSLFQAIGNSYGGDGSTTFSIPNMLGLEPIFGMNYFICNTGIYPVKDQ